MSILGLAAFILTVFLTYIELRGVDQKGGGGYRVDLSELRDDNMNTMVSCQPKIELTQELIYILDKIQKIHPTSQFSAHHHTKHQGRENKQSGFS